MQTRSRIFDDISQLMTNAMGVAQGARDEAETAMKGWIDRWLADRDFVTREEFDAVRAMAQKAREENEALKARLDALDAARRSKRRRGPRGRATPCWVPARRARARASGGSICAEMNAGAARAGARPFDFLWAKRKCRFTGFPFAPTISRRAGAVSPRPRAGTKAYGHAEAHGATT
jgi:BMFP domain-containing protein YqiC